MGIFDHFRKLISESKELAEEGQADAFYQKLGYLFRDRHYLLQALTHRSFTRVSSSDNPSNERLEYLGDSILGMIIAEYLYQNYPDYDEGDLTKTKALLVNEAALSMIGRDCGLNNLILLSPEEEKSGGRQRNSIISDAVEAVIGAIYLDGGLNAAKDFVQRFIITRLGEIVTDANQRNYKGELLEYLQGRGEPAPHYEVISEEGPDHEKVFTVAVHTGGKRNGVGTGQSKKEAEQKAAAVSLENLKRTEKNGSQ